MLKVRSNSTMLFENLNCGCGCRRAISVDDDDGSKTDQELAMLWLVKMKIFLVLRQAHV